MSDIPHEQEWLPPGVQGWASPREEAPATEAENEAGALPETRARRGRSAPRWEVEAKDRLRAGIRRFSKPMSDLLERDANEGDTRLLVTDFLCEALGFDKYEDLTTEYQVKGEFADYGLRVDKQLVAFIEVKRVTTTLATKHLRQAQMYAVNEGVEWIILTNGVVWRVYHVGASVPVEIDLALEVDLLGEDTVAQKANQLFYLTRESFKRRQIDELWRQKKATSPKSLASVLTSPAVAEAIRKELWRETKQRVVPDEIVRLLKETVIRESCL